MHAIHSVLPNQNIMNPHNRLTIGDARDAVAAVRAIIEREFAWLHRHQPRLLQLALNEAEALAWQTGYPQLVFPVLALEKAVGVATWHFRQQSVRQREPILSFAA